MKRNIHVLFFPFGASFLLYPTIAKAAARITTRSRKIYFFSAPGKRNSQYRRSFDDRAKTIEWLWETCQTDEDNHYTLDLNENRDFTLMTESPKILKETLTITDALPDIVKITIGPVAIFYRGTHLIGFRHGHVKMRLDTAHASPLDGFPVIHSYHELVRNLYKALAQETGDRVNEWVDKKLIG